MSRKITGAGKRKREKKTGSGRMMIYLAAVGLAVFGISTAAARYVHSTNRNDTAAAKEFYFKSDLLDGISHTVIPFNEENGEKTASVTFTLMNHEDELRYSDVDIKYTVSLEKIKEENGVKTYEKITLNDENSENATGIIMKKQRGDQQVVLKKLEQGTSYRVSAETENTYKKALTGTIIVEELDEKVYSSLADRGAYVEVTVWTVDYSDNIEIKYGVGLIPDNTDPLMAGAKRAGGGMETISISSGSMGTNASHVFRFFKENGEHEYKTSVNGKQVTISEN